MKKNVAGQFVGAEMVSATDGSAFSGPVTCFVTGDGGSQALGSVSSGACTGKGNGLHQYAPSQSETNHDLIAFTFTGSGAIPSTVQVYTGFPQTVDNATDVGAIRAKTDSLNFTVPGVVDANTTRIKGTASAGAAGYVGVDWGSVNAPTTAVALAGTTIAASQVVASVAGAVGSVTGAVGSVAGNVGGNVAGSTASVTGAVGSVTAPVAITSNIKKNQALSAFPFTMKDSTNHAFTAGFTVTATRSLDGGAFAACANTPTSLGNGDYKINLAATDTNANTIMLHFSAAGADDTRIGIVTQP